MKPSSFTVIALLLFALLTLQSCGGGGSDKGTNGSLTVSTPTVTGPTGGVYTVSATVTYTPPTGKVPNGLQVNVTSGGTTVPHYLDSTGIFTITDFVAQTSSSILYTISASTGDLTSSVGVVLAGFTPLNANPSPIVFAQTDAAGTAKTSTIGGGLSPYAVSIDSSAASDLQVTISGSTMSVTKLGASGATQKTGTITVTDSTQNTISVTVIYY